MQSSQSGRVLYSRDHGATVVGVNIFLKPTASSFAHGPIGKTRTSTACACVLHRSRKGTGGTARAFVIVLVFRPVRGWKGSCSREWLRGIHPTAGVERKEALDVESSVESEGRKVFAGRGCLGMLSARTEV